jgi:ubiquinone/menaquinone biosynthesis C-methylase UbiE
MTLHPNYRYVLKKSFALVNKKGIVLDYGCGKGVIVEEGRKNNMNFYGTELFSAGSGVNIKEYMKNRGLLGDVIREINGGKIPFADGFFNLVVSNQVLEHVFDLDHALSEISRVLGKNGKFLCIFPSKETIREAHCGILFAHWFPEKSRFQYYWLLIFRLLGFGRLKHKRTYRQWAEFFCDWIPKNTQYRSIDEIRESFSSYFDSLKHIEDEYIAFRLEEKGLLKLATFFRKMPLNKFSGWFCRKWGSLVLIAEKK